MVNPTTATTVQVSTVSSIPALHAFDSHTTTWQSYRDRISFYFKANRIIQDDDKKALFLWSVGDATYNLLESLISPRSLTSEDTTFDEIIKLLNLHYDDTKNIMTSTYDFYSCIQKPGQSFAEWKAELCEKMRHCGFTTSCLRDKPQDRALRDMYVIGIRTLKVRQALLKEQDPDLETTERIIQVAERLAEDVRHFNGSGNNTEYTVSKLQRSQTKQHTQQQHRSTSKVDSKQCESCGANNHIRSECKYRTVSCNFCKRTGHLERVCRKKKEGKSVIKHLTTSFNNINQKESTTDSTRISLLVNGINIPFDLDTGAAHTVINMDVWHKLGSPVMHSSKIKLNCYNGTILKIIGQCNVNVEHNGRFFDLHIIVVDGNGISLLGLEWIKIMKLDLNTIIHGADIPSPMHKIHNNN